MSASQLAIVASTAPPFICCRYSMQNAARHGRRRHLRRGHFALSALVHKYTQTVFIILHGGCSGVDVKRRRAPRRGATIKQSSLVFVYFRRLTWSLAAWQSCEECAEYRSRRRRSEGRARWNSATAVNNWKLLPPGLLADATTHFSATTTVLKPAQTPVASTCLSICCTTSPQTVETLQVEWSFSLWLKLYYFNLLWICCTFCATFY